MFQDMKTECSKINNQWEYTRWPANLKKNKREFLVIKCLCQIFGDWLLTALLVYGDAVWGWRGGY